MRRRVFDIALLVLVLGLIPFLWYRPESLIFGHDTEYALDPLMQFRDRLFAWSHRGSLGANTSELGAGFWIHLPEALTSMFLPPQTAQQVAFAFWILMPALAMYFLITSMGFSTRGVGLVGAIFYTLNHYTLQAWLIAERPKFSIMTSIPLILGLMIRASEGRMPPKRAAAFAAIVFGVFNAGMAPNLWAPQLLAIATATLYLLPKRKRGQFLIFAATLIALGIVVNMHGILGWMVAAKTSYVATVDDWGGVQGLLDWTRMISKHSSFLNVARLQGFTGDSSNLLRSLRDYGWDKNILEGTSWLLPLVVFGLLLRRERLSEKQPDKYMTLWLVTAIVSALLSTGTSGPLPGLYEWLMVHIPYFVVLRTPFYKFGALLWLSYSVLISYSVDRAISWLRRRLLPHRIGEPAHAGVVAAVLLGIAVYSYPFFTGSVFAWHPDGRTTMPRIPDYVWEYAAFLRSPQMEEARVLIWPKFGELLPVESLRWGYWSLGSTSRNAANRSAVVNDPYAKQLELTRELVELIYDWVQDGRSNAVRNALAFTGVNYILVQNDYWYDHPDLQGDPTGPFDPQIARQLERDHVIDFYRSFGEWDLYTVASIPRARFQLASDLTTVVTDRGAEAALLARSLQSSAFTISTCEQTVASAREACDPGVRESEVHDGPISYLFTEQHSTFRTWASGEFTVVSHLSPHPEETPPDDVPERTDWAAEFAAWAVNRPSREGEPPIIIPGQGFHLSESDPHGTWRWATEKSELVVFNPTNLPMQGTLKFRLSTIEPKEVQISLNGRKISNLLMSSHFDRRSRSPGEWLQENLLGISLPPYELPLPRRWQEVALENITLVPGYNQVTLYTPETAKPIDQLLGGGDERLVAFQVWGDPVFEPVQDVSMDSRPDEAISSSMGYEASIEGDELIVKVNFGSDSNTHKYVLMSKEFGWVDIEEFPSFRLVYEVDDPGALKLDAAFGLDVTGDHQVDHYVVAQPTFTGNDTLWQISVDLLEQVKQQYPDLYFRDGLNPRLARMYLILHRQWGLDTVERAAWGSYRFKNLQLCSKHQLPNTSQATPSFEGSLKDLRALSSPVVSIDGQPLRFEAAGADRDSGLQEEEWVHSLTVSLEAGQHRVEILPNAMYGVDLVEVIGQQPDMGFQNSEISFSEVNPTRYELEVHASRDSWLIFNESFHPGWKAYVLEGCTTQNRSLYHWSALFTWLLEGSCRTELANHRPVNAFANGWQVPEEGDHTIVLEYTPQRLLEMGAVCSAFTLSCCFGFLLSERKKGRPS